MDERQITHLICARLKYDLYDFLRGCFGAFYTRERTGSRPKTPLKKSYRAYFRWAHRLYSLQELPIIQGRKSHKSEEENPP